MGQVSTEEDIAQAVTDRAVLDGRMSADLQELAPIPADLSVRRESTKLCVVSRKNVPVRDDHGPARPNPNVRARPLTSSRADLDYKKANILLKLHASIRAHEKRKRVIIVPD